MSLEDLRKKLVEKLGMEKFGEELNEMISQLSAAEQPLFNGYPLIKLANKYGITWDNPQEINMEKTKARNKKGIVRMVTNSKEIIFEDEPNKYYRPEGKCRDFVSNKLDGKEVEASLHPEEADVITFIKATSWKNAKKDYNAPSAPPPEAPQESHTAPLQQTSGQKLADLPREHNILTLCVFKELMGMAAMRSETVEQVLNNVPKVVEELKKLCK